MGKSSFMPWVISYTLELKGKLALATIEKNSHDAMGINQRRLMEILRRNQNTEYGNKYHFDQIHSVEEYISRIPLSDYNTFLPYIERMTNGERNLITSYPVVLYAETSGSAGVQKTIPVTGNSVKMYSKYSIARAIALFSDYYKRSVRKMYRGRLLSTLEVKPRYMPDGCPVESISSSICRL